MLARDLPPRQKSPMLIVALASIESHGRESVTIGLLRVVSEVSEATLTSFRLSKMASVCGIFFSHDFWSHYVVDTQAHLVSDE